MIARSMASAKRAKVELSPVAPGGGHPVTPGQDPPNIGLMSEG